MLRGINLRKIAEKMGGSSGAEVKGTCTEAGQFFDWLIDRDRSNEYYPLIERPPNTWDKCKFVKF